jgi:hypothetical protein
MRGEDEGSEGLFSYVSCSARVAKDHPLRTIRRLVDGALEALSGDFAKLYAKLGRPSIPPEKLLRAPFASVLLCALRAPVDGATRLQSVVSLVRRAVDGRALSTMRPPRDRDLNVGGFGACLNPLRQTG